MVDHSPTCPSCGSDNVNPAGDYDSDNDSAPQRKAAVSIYRCECGVDFALMVPQQESVESSRDALRR